MTTSQDTGYRQSHQGCGLDYHDRFSGNPRRRMMWRIEQQVLGSVLDAVQDQHSGEIDYLLKVLVSDIAEYDRIYKELIDVVELFDVSSSFAMERIKYTTAIPLHDVRRPARLILMLGNETDGLGDELTGLCDHSWTIPMTGLVDSINVSVAAGIFLHTVFEQGRRLES